ncbi:glycoside hydrolase family 78 protein [Athelia psychrophila]|uniref:Glycoside hydrolase family 78 protein n=1 Tax=Athelia psychrophila TaxID=1759441 RepID=A0A165XAD4_9AGAM|nr:glycoside hydrolase family 78 protein [Fibularhizoctonia sp. CBS 109695]
MFFHRKLIAGLLVLPYFILATTAQPRAERDWQQYVRSPSSRVVLPVSTTANASSGATLQGGSSVLLTVASGVTPIPVPYVDVDFGQVVSGQLRLNISGASDPAPQLRISFCEAEKYIAFYSDYSRTVYSSDPRTTDDLVPSPAGESWSDTAACQFPAQNAICADGQRGFRYARIFVQQTAGAENYSAPTGWVNISSVSLDFTPYLGVPATYEGYFLSSDEQLNRIWYASVYSVELNTDTFLANSTDPRNAASASLEGKTVLMDGAKRDRDPYAGDVAVQSLVDFVSHAAGVGSRNVLEDLAAHQRSDGWIPPASINNYTLPLFDYPAWWAVATANYFLYTGNTAFAAGAWGPLKALMDTWYPSVTNTTTGLLDKSGDTYGSYGDYAFLPRSGQVTYYQGLYIQALRGSAQLAESLGHADEAAEWRQRADGVASAVAEHLWDAGAGTWWDSVGANGSACHSQDAAAFATLAGVGTPAQANSSLGWITATLGRSWGNGMVDADCFGAGTSDRVYAFLGYPEVLARFASDDAAGALEELRRTWGWMVDSNPGNTTWEATGAGGDVENYEGNFTSLAHGWAAGAAPALSNEVMGVKPTSPGFATYDVIPKPGNLSWVEGIMPTPLGGIAVSWAVAVGGGFSLEVTAPAGTVGRLGVPASGNTTVVSLNQTSVWDGTGAVGGANATTDGLYVYLGGLAAGTHNLTASAM